MPCCQISMAHLISLRKYSDLVLALVLTYDGTTGIKRNVIMSVFHPGEKNLAALFTYLSNFRFNLTATNPLLQLTKAFRT